MTIIDIDFLLTDAVSKYGDLIGLNLTKKIVESIIPTSETEILKSKEMDPFLNARNALMECGKVLREDRNGKIVEGIIYSGVGNMNPAIVVISVSGIDVTISAFAKEGLINQHTARKAIQRYASVF